MISNFAAIDDQLAKQLGLTQVMPLEQINEQQAVFALDQQQLVLYLLLDKKLQRLAFSLDQGDVAERANKVSKTNELIAKAIGCKPHYRPRVLDATAGMGRDSLILLMLGCRVIMQERNPMIYLLLQNAVQRFKSNQQYDQLTFDRLELKQANSLLTFEQLSDVDVIYLDPMFPERKKSALVKKEMRLFKKVAGDDSDADALLTAALKSSVARVVVKRPKGANSLAEIKPSHQIVAKKFRFDVYIK